MCAILNYISKILLSSIYCPRLLLLGFLPCGCLGVTRGLLFHYVRKGNAILITIILFIDITASEEPEPQHGWVLLLSSHNQLRDISFHLREWSFLAQDNTTFYLGVDSLF